MSPLACSLAIFLFKFHQDLCNKCFETIPLSEFRIHIIFLQHPIHLSIYSFFILLIHQLCRDARDNPSWLWMRGGVIHGQPIANLLTGLTQRQITIHPHIHTYRQLRVANVANQSAQRKPTQAREEHSNTQKGLNPKPSCCVATPYSYLFFKIILLEI